MDADYKYLECESEYGGKKQRWILVRNRRSKYKEIDTFNINLGKEEAVITPDELINGLDDCEQEREV